MKFKVTESAIFQIENDKNKTTQIKLNKELMLSQHEKNRTQLFHLQQKFKVPNRQPMKTSQRWRYILSNYHF